MTFNSAWITLDDGRRAPDTALPAGAATSVKLPSDCATIWTLRAWSGQAGIAVQYVDNAWIYCSVSRAQLATFLPVWCSGDSQAATALISDLDTAFGDDQQGPFFLDVEEF